MKRKPRNGQIYPWKDWFRVKEWELVKGEHFWVDPYVMAMQVRNAATRYGFSVSIKIERTVIGVTVSEI